jgi:hypothetical protein
VLSEKFCASLCGRAHCGGADPAHLCYRCLPACWYLSERKPLISMTSAEGVALASKTFQGSATAFLVLLDAFLNARGDPLAEAMVGDVKRFVYSKTEHSESAMDRLISEAGKDLTHLAA